MTAVNGNFNGQHIADSFNDPTKHAQIYHYLETLKSDEFGWKKSVENIIQNNTCSVEEHFLLLQVIEDYLSKKYVVADPDNVLIVRSFLLHWIQKIDSAQAIPSFLVNKMAHIFSLVFAVDFPNRWPSFIDDIFLSNGFNSIPFICFYLRTLIAIDEEVVNKDIQRSKEMFDRNTKIKDHMREICIPQMVQSWWTILDSVNDATAQCLCLDVVSAYVDWIDLELVANDVFVPIVIARLANKETLESAIRAITGLIQKGMPPNKKLSLLLALGNVIRSNQLLSITPESDSDDFSRVGSLLNTMGLVLIDCYSRFKAEGNAEEAQQCLSLIELDIDAYMLVLDCVEPELSENVVDAIRAYILLIREECDEKAVQFFSRVIDVCLRRYVMNDELEIDREGEDELEFQEYRKELRSLMNSIGMKKPLLVIEPLESIITETSNSAAMPIRRLEAAIQLVHALSELIPSNFVQGKDVISARAIEIILNLLSGMTLDGRSSTVTVLYFEIACRYERILAARPDTIVPLIASSFLDERGIATPFVKIRTRIVYLFCRFVKAHKTALSSLVSEVIGRLAPLLAVSPNSEQFLSSDDQAFIFEATSTLIVFGNLPVEQKAGFIRELATSLVDKFRSAAVELELSRSKNNVETSSVIEQFMRNIVGYVSRMSKAFNSVSSIQQCQCFDIFVELLKLFLEHLNPQNSFLLEPVRQLSHRMVICLDEEFLPMLPTVLNKIAVVSNDLDSINHLLILAHQIVAKHKKKISAIGLDMQTILTTAARYSVDIDHSSVDKTQDESIQRNLVYVQRAFLQLLYTTAINDMLTDVTTTETKSVLLEAAAHLALGSDQSAQKLALSTLSKVATTENDYWEKTLRIALQVPSLPHVCPADAGSTLVVHEVSSTLLALKQSNSVAFDAAVRTLLPGEMANSLLHLLDTTKSKELDKQIMNLYSSLKISS